jgi:2-polyprenyl-6-methoxyphenol hydroxylase-like FAD-dependent oxidoreductase
VAKHTLYRPRREPRAALPEDVLKIVCIGGGPAGLYFAILMKKANPAHEITVLEREGKKQLERALKRQQEMRGLSTE